MTRREIARESWRRFVGYVPEMGRPAFAAGWALAVAGAAAALLAAGAWLSRRVSYGGLAAQAALIVWVGGWAWLGFWRHRDAYRARFGDAAYRALFLRFLSPAAAGLAAATFLPMAVAGGPKLPPAVSLAVGGYLFLTAALITARGRPLFWNIDLRAFVYSVFPERGVWVRSPLFERLRHPIYSSAVRWLLGMGVVLGHAESVGCAALLAAGFGLWARVEDREMAARFPDYDRYCRAVPALFAPPRVWPAFFRYLWTGRGDDDGVGAAEAGPGARENDGALHAPDVGGGGSWGAGGRSGR